MPDVLTPAHAERLGRALHACVWRSGQGYVSIKRTPSGAFTVRAWAGRLHGKVRTGRWTLTEALEHLYDVLEGRTI